MFEFGRMRTVPLGPLLAILMAVSSTCTLALEQPNIVFIISDDHDNEHLGFMGNSIVHTPNLDRLAHAGTLFTRAHLPMSRCHPTLASFLSGRWPHQTGIYYNFGREKLDPAGSLPRLLKQAGYATYVEGKYWEGAPREMGFTHGKGKNAKRFVRDGQEDLFAFIDERGGKQPLFIWWAPLIPHTPHNPPKQYLDLFNREKIPVPAWIAEEERSRFLDREHLSLAMEAWLDDGVGQLEAKLRDKGILDETMFVFVIDNGWSNGLVSKGSPFEKGVRTPVFFSWPGRVPARQRLDCLTSTLDLFPTLLSYAGVEAPESVVGKNLRPIIEGKTTRNRDRLFGAIYPAFVTKSDPRAERDIYALYVRDERWKYILYLQDVVQSRNKKYFRIQSIITDYPTRAAGDEDLYDLKADPVERNNLASLLEHKERMQSMRQAVLKWWAETGGKPLDALKKNSPESLAADIQPFEIRVDDAVLSDLRRRLERVRFPDEIDGARWDYGTNLAYMKDLTEYWLRKYDWRAEERKLNALDQFTTDIDGTQIHFIHQRSKEAKALPLVFMHGWPGTNFEFAKVIGPLTDPVAHGGRAEDAFHVVCPAIPGYGFSGKPRESGMHTRRVGDLVAKLMARLGYTRYGAQGGDWGSGIVSSLARRHADHVVGIHLNFVSAGPPPGAADRYENVPRREIDRYEKRKKELEDHWGYGRIQGTRPQTLGYGLNDSPVGLAAWIIDKFHAWSDCDGDLDKSFTKDELLTNVMLYWVTQSITSSTRFYFENRKNPRSKERVEVPTAVAIFPREIVLPPRRWVEARYNVHQWVEMPHGGHFAALEEPDSLIADLRGFFSTLR